MKMDENDSIKYGNLIFYNIEIPELKQKFKEHNFKILKYIWIIFL